MLSELSLAQEDLKSAQEKDSLQALGIFAAIGAAAVFLILMFKKGGE